jgi:hypothetical protein
MPEGRGFMCEFASGIHRLGYFKNGAMIKSFDPNGKNNNIIYSPNHQFLNEDAVLVG